SGCWLLVAPPEEVNVVDAVVPGELVTIGGVFGLVWGLPHEVDVVAAPMLASLSGLEVRGFVVVREERVGVLTGSLEAVEAPDGVEQLVGLAALEPGNAEPHEGFDAGQHGAIEVLRGPGDAAGQP